MRLRNKVAVNCFAAATAWTWKLLFRTVRAEFHFESNIDPYNPPADQRFIWAMWHDMAVIPIFARRQARTTALVSLHRDGTFVEGVLKQANLPVVRGSSGRGGSRALRTLLALAQTRDIAVTPDGPRGPRRQIKDGIVYLASRCGNPIVPTAYQASRCWRIRGSWTDLVIPKPFSRVIVLIGVPISIPRQLSRNDLQPYARRIQTEMERLDAEALNLLDGRRSKHTLLEPGNRSEGPPPVAAA